MKKNFLAAITILIAAIFLTGNANSQHQDKASRTPEEIAQKISDKLKTKLTLSDDQYKQVYDMALNHAREMVNNKEKYKSMDKSSRKEQYKQNKDSFRKQLETILNQDQIRKLNEMKQKHHDKSKVKKHEKTK